MDDETEIKVSSGNKDDEIDAFYILCDKIKDKYGLPSLVLLLMQQYDAYKSEYYEVQSAEDNN